MVFEGKLIHPKPVATPKPVVTPKPVATPKPVISKPTPTEPITPKKKSHFFRNLILYTIGLTTIAYAGGVYYSLEDDAFRDTFTEQVPFAENLVYFIEEQRFKRKFSNTLPSVNGVSSSDVSSTITSSKTTSTASRAGSLSSWTAATENSKAPKSTEKKSQAVSSDPSKPSPKVELPLITVPEGADESVTKSIDSLNNFIKLVNESTVSSKDIDVLSKDVYALIDTIDRVKAAAKAEADQKDAVAAGISKTEHRLESTIAEMKTALNAQEEKWAREYHEEAKRLAHAHNDRLQGEVGAHSKVIFAHANNQLLAIHVARENEFAEQAASRIDKERNGRLAKLEDLSNQLSEVQQLTAKANEVIEQSDRAAKLQLAVTKLRAALNSDEPVPLAPYFNILKQLVNAKTQATKDDTPSLDADTEFLGAVLDAVPQEALQTGVLSPAQLVARFHLLEPELRSASLVPPNAGILGHFGSLIFSKLLWKKSGNPQGDDVEAVLSRANTALSEGRVTDAVAEVNSLKGWPKKLASDWLNEGRKRAEIEFLTELLTEDGKLYY